MPAPLLGSLSVDAQLRVEVPVVELGGNEAVRVDIALAPTEPAESSLLWRPVGTVTGPETVLTAAQARGTTVWVRASGRTAAGHRTSLFTPAESLEIPEVARLAVVQLAIERGVAIVTWTPAALAAGVRIGWVLHDPADDPGEPSDREDLEASVGTFEIPDGPRFGEAVTITVEAWDGWDSDLQAVDGELGETAVLTATRVRAARDLGGFFLEAGDGSRWRLTISHSGELGTEEIV